MKVIAALDGGRAGESAVRAASVLGIIRNAHLILLHVVPEGYHIMSADAYEKLFEREAMKSAHLYLEKISKEFEPEAERVEIRVIHGNPKLEIPKFAEREEADLIVMGTKGAGGLAGAFLGSVAQAVIAQSKIPVLVVPYRP
jgi:nucleotide-binding universal stress UspA family protein